MQHDDACPHPAQHPSGGSKGPRPSVGPWFGRRARGRELSDQLAAFRPAAIHTSPERKARETAAIIAARLGTSILQDEALEEHRRSNMGFLPQPEFEDGICRMVRSPTELVLGEESADAVFVRFQDALDRARRASANSALFVVSHGTAISIYIGRVLGVDAWAFWRSLTTPMAMIISDGVMHVLALASARTR
jgi:broad specificity phosphatase PhoE